MDIEIIIAIATVGTIVIFLLGSPIILCVGLWVSATALLADDFSLLANIGQASFYGLKSFTLLALPLFILTGDVVLHSGIAGAIVGFSRSILGRMPGSTALTALFASGGFAAISGSNAATTATIGGMMYPELTKDGYSPGFAGALCASGGTVGIIIPPSVLFIVYGVLTSTSIGDLFIAGIVPGLMMIAAMAIVAVVKSWRNSWGKRANACATTAAKEAWRAKHAFLAIVFALGGIYYGVFSPTEAAGMTVAYLVAATVISGLVRPRQLPGIMLASAEIIGVLGPLIAFSMVLQEVLSFFGVASAIQGFLLGIDNESMLILAIVIVIFVSGMVLESLPNVIIWAPILAPVAIQAGFDAIHFGVVFMVGIAIGFITPPYGLNLFVASGVTGLSFGQITRNISSFVIALLATWALIILFPTLSLGLL